MARRMSTVWYFAYGSNMSSATLRGRREVSCVRALPARVPGWRLVLDKPPLIPLNRAFANIVADPATEVLGVIYEVSLDDLDHIELTEGVRIGNYDRVEVTAWPLSRADAAPLAAFSLTSAKRDASLRPSRSYMDLLIAGAIEHGLPDPYIEHLRLVPADPDDEEAVRWRPIMDAGMRKRNGHGTG